MRIDNKYFLAIILANSGITVAILGIVSALGGFS